MDESSGTLPLPALTQLPGTASYAEESLALPDRDCQPMPPTTPPPLGPPPNWGSPLCPASLPSTGPDPLQGQRPTTPPVGTMSDLTMNGTGMRGTGQIPRDARSSPGTRPEPPRRSTWLFADLKSQGGGGVRLHLPAAPGRHRAWGGDARRRSAARLTLFPKATWEIPRILTGCSMPTRLFRGNSCRTSIAMCPAPFDSGDGEQVEDQWGRGFVLIPQYTELITQQEGRPPMARTGCPLPSPRGLCGPDPTPGRPLPSRMPRLGIRPARPASQGTWTTTGRRWRPAPLSAPSSISA